MIKGNLLFLGTGGSMGVPVIGCQCAVCKSDSPFNKRLRPSVLIRFQNRVFLIDSGPDFRQQALRYGITSLDGVIYTHAHHDHTSGIDDLRPIYYRRETPLPVLLSHVTAQDLQKRFYYLFQSSNPRLHVQILPEQEGVTEFQGVEIHYVTYTQGGMAVNGFRFGDLAYLSDIRHFSPIIFEHLKGVRYLIISALRYTPSPLHLSVDEAVDFAKQLGVEQTWLTHISHELDHFQTNAYLPSNIRLAYDGLAIEFE